MSSIQERVARGAAWLDDVRPGWRDQMSLDTLRLLSAKHCVLGQVFAQDDAEILGFFSGLEILCRAACNAERTDMTIENLGFNASMPDLPDGPERWHLTCAQTEELAAEWRRVIHAPQPARVPA